MKQQVVLVLSLLAIVPLCAEQTPKDVSEERLQALKAGLYGDAFSPIVPVKPEATETVETDPLRVADRKLDELEGSTQQKLQQCSVLLAHQVGAGIRKVLGPEKGYHLENFGLHHLNYSGNYARLGLVYGKLQKEHADLLAQLASKDEQERENARKTLEAFGVEYFERFYNEGKWKKESQ